MKIDVVALGETMIRLTPPGYNRIEQSHHLEMHVGGSESNTLIGLSRLGLSTVWLSRLNCNPLGQLVASSLRSHGVDVGLAGDGARQLPARGHVAKLAT